MPPLSDDRFDSLAKSLGIEFSTQERAEVDGLRAVTGGFVGALEAVLDAPEPPRAPVVSRAFERPSPTENPYGAWVVRTSVRERDSGLLAGRSVVLKDNVALAGVPMAGGTDFLEGYVPEEDATIVERMLAEGAEIVGKSACEYLSASAGSHTSASGRVSNPRDPSRTAGGSSSGSGALLAAGEVDLAIGGDQGGSIRYPASYCGIVGMKPTHGLVPYTGILSLDAHIDHTGPMTRNVRDNALLLNVLAGPDGIDPRQTAVRVADYLKDLDTGVAGLRIGLLDEGFHESIESGVDQAVRQVASTLGTKGARIETVSVPGHISHGALIAAFLMVGNWALVSNGGFPLHACQPDPLRIGRSLRSLAQRRFEDDAKREADVARRGTRQRGAGRRNLRKGAPPAGGGTRRLRPRSGRGRCPADADDPDDRAAAAARERRSCRVVAGDLAGHFERGALRCVGASSDFGSLW